ncbi:hypothetical protein BB561_000500 [Smittium simulii]|uniref:Uncharacterized protein n=1 Tax=Smittium simulii TaxID=133385 RepID=A0A2T9YYW2_9FUNG|nr:hypothetical protein BB561_000500 [Smittium simulii]
MAIKYCGTSIKKGGLKYFNNYREISLIPTMIKLVSNAATNKLNKIINSNNIPYKEQSGFITREEYAAQVTTLYEIVRQCRLLGLKTWMHVQKSTNNRKGSYQLLPTAPYSYCKHWVATQSETIEQFIPKLFRICNNYKHKPLTQTKIKPVCKLLESIDNICVARALIFDKRKYPTAPFNRCLVDMEPLEELAELSENYTSKSKAL